MSGLHQACARALYDDRVWDDTREVPWEEADDFQRSFFLEQAAAAVRVCLAEAGQALPVPRMNEPLWGYRERAQAVLAALAEDEA